MQSISENLALRTPEILALAQRRKSAIIRVIDVSLYWVMLFLAIIGNLVLSVAIVPFLLVLKGITLYLSLFMIALSFGILFSFLLHSIQKLASRKHILATVFIPALALINVAIFAILSNKLIAMLHLTTPPHNPFLIGAVYMLGYVLPEALIHPTKKWLS
ncbi:MAG TPA: hypothetical protein VJJ82_05215 [Candidatus Nanoarchaeia archaeon]|nr:hypothetical protein [Candidatus Nanoarchaeia archaeon]